MASEHRLTRITHAVLDADGTPYPPGRNGPPENALCSCGWEVQSPIPEEVRAAVEGHVGAEGLAELDRF